MERASEDVSVDDRPPDDADDDESDFVEVDPSGRYGRYDEVLGKGAHKTVYKAFDEVEGIEVAWNQVKVQDILQNPGDMERVYSELHLLKTLKHKNIIKFYSSWVDIQSNNVNFITEIFTSGTLRQYRKRHKHVDLKAVKNWSRQILRGLLYLHSHDPPIIHRDLKCDNIFINGNQGEVKIGDLGLATILRQAHAAHSVIGTPEFMAPELYEEEYNELVDIYSFGMCLLEMITSEYPYSECTNAAQIYKKVTTGKRPAALDKVKEPQVRDFVKKCLASVSQRLHARELLMDPFLHSEEEYEIIECVPQNCITQNPCDEMKRLDSIPEESDLWHAMHEPSGEQEQKSNFLDAVSMQDADYLNLPSPSSMKNPSLLKETSNITATEALYKRPDSPMSKNEGLLRSRDFRIKGKMQEGNKILVRIRITSPRGGLRYIQFDFDVEADTSMSVASEMVTELDLCDQDVTTIAEMIDAEILALVPDWKPGVSLDEAWVDEETPGGQLRTFSGDLHGLQRLSDDLSPLVLDDSFISLNTGGERKFLTSPNKTEDSELVSVPRNEGSMYGRFEEVGYRLTASDHSQQESDVLGFFSDSSDQFEEGGSTLSLDAGLEVETSSASQIFEELRVVTAGESTIELMEALNSNSGIETGLNCRSLGRCPVPEQSLNSSPSFHEEEPEDVRALQFSSFIPQGGIEEDAGADELRLLALQHEQEMQLLRFKHEQALLDLKMRLQVRDESAKRSKVLLGEPIQAMGESVHSSVSVCGFRSQSRQEMEPQTRPIKSVEHETDFLEASAAAIRKLGMPEMSTLNLGRDLSGSSLPLVSQHELTVGTKVIDLPFEQENVFQHELSNSEPTSRREELEVERASIITSKGVDDEVAGTHKDNTRIFSSEKDMQVSKADLTEKERLIGFIVGNLGDDAEQTLVRINDIQDVRSKVEFQPDLMDKEKAALLSVEAIEVPDGRESRVMPSHDNVKPDWTSITKRESYLEFYKAGVIQKDKLPCPKPTDFLGSRERDSKSASSKNNDLEQQKKEQLQKSIAELEAKTLEGLLQSKSKYLVSSSVRNNGVGAVQSSQPGSSATHVRQHVTPEITRA